MARFLTIIQRWTLAALLATAPVSAFAQPPKPAYVTGSPTTGAIAKASGSQSITTGDLSGDCATSATLATICLKTNGVNFGYFATGTDAANLTGTVACARLPALTGDVTTSAGSCSTTVGANKVTLGGISQIGANTVLGNATASSANVAAQSMPSCSTSTSALKWTTSTGFGCNALGTFADQSYATPPAIGGATPAAGSFSSLKDTAITGLTQCVQADTLGALSGTGTACGSGGGASFGTAPTYRGSTNASITGTSTTLTLPAGTVAGDFLVFIGSGGNLGYPTTSGNASSSGWTKVFSYGGYWTSEVFTRTVTSGDVSTGNIAVTVAGSFINFASISTFASGAYLASLGYSPLSFETFTGTLPTTPVLSPSVGDVRANSNMFYLAQVSARAENVAQTASPGTLVGTQLTNTNGSWSLYRQTFSGTIPLFLVGHGGSSYALGDVCLGILAP